MNEEYIFNKTNEFKNRFQRLTRNQKEVRALENFSTISYFPHRHHLTLVRACMKNGFLDDPTCQFLSHMLKKYDVDYLDWSHKTPWLKREMAQIIQNAQKRVKPPQICFDFDKKAKVPIAIPTEVLMGKRIGFYKAAR